MPRPILLFAAATLALAGCDVVDGTGYAGCAHIGGEAWTWVVDDPDNCGGCGIACMPGVPCVDYECRMDSVMHCGAAYRRCMAADDEGRAMACVRYFDGDAAVGDAGPPPEGVELVGGYGCVPVGEPGGDAGVAGDAGIAGEPKRRDPRWLIIPGHTPACADGLDTNGCVTAEVDLAALCGGGVEPVPYDIAIMTGEMSRGQYRELMCDCADPRFDRCRTLCAERDAPDAAERDLLPMTGLNWCEAYDACRALDARLPTVRERALLEALAEAPPGLFGEEATCRAWAEETGRVPWLAECQERPAGELWLDDVKGKAGQVFVRPVAAPPEPVHHLIGNVDEWMADPAALLVSGGAGEIPGVWGPPQTAAETRQARVLRGRSLFSPAGQPGARIIAVEPSVRAEDVGVRCARTVGSPFDRPVPYDASRAAEDHAECVTEPIALRPVRHTVGEQVYRAVSVCIDSERGLPDEVRRDFAERARELFTSDTGIRAFVRRTSAGQLHEVGAARIALDEQWWLAEPAAEVGQRVAFSLGEMETPVWLTWMGEEMPRTSACAEAAADSTDAFGRLVRRHAFVIDRNQSWVLGRGGVETGCDYLECADPTVEPAECMSECPGWILPFALDFRRVEPGSALALCR